LPWAGTRDKEVDVRRRSLTLIGGIALVVAATVVTPTTAARTSRSAVPAPLVGTWGKTVAIATWHKYGEYAEPAGHWSIVTTARGVTTLYMPPGITTKSNFVTTMPVVATGSSVSFGPTADNACETKGTYTWKQSGRTLSLKVVNDSCQPRRILYSAGVWLRK
jgi:hypothetical protein